MKEIRFLIVICSLLVCSVEAVFAEGVSNLELMTEYFSKYIRRGQNLDDASEACTVRCRVCPKGVQV
jgi:hypothetical protein